MKEVSAEASGFSTVHYRESGELNCLEMDLLKPRQITFLHFIF